MLDLSADIVDLTAALIEVDSESFQEKELADLVEAALRSQTMLEVIRENNTIVARTQLDMPDRVVIAGHLDTVPANDNRGARNDGEFIHGLGSCDMKGGVAVALKLAATVTRPVRDVTYVFYEAEEVAAIHNGLGTLADSRPDLLAGDFAILMEPSNGIIEAGCQGTLRFDVLIRGQRAHSARSWMGANAIHAAAPILETLRAYTPRTPRIDGLTFREGLNAVAIAGGVAGNVIPDEARVTVNYRFAPDLDIEAAWSHVQEVFAGYTLELTDSAPGALPGLERPAASAFVTAAGGEVQPKFGWTDVSRFSALGIPAVNFGPGDPLFAHRHDERVPIVHLRSVESVMIGWLSGA